MGGRAFAGVAVIRDFHELVHTAHHDRFICRTGSDRIELCRALGLWSEHRRFSDCLESSRPCFGHGFGVRLASSCLLL